MLTASIVSARCLACLEDVFGYGINERPAEPHLVVVGGQAPILRRGPEGRADRADAFPREPAAGCKLLKRRVGAAGDKLPSLAPLPATWGEPEFAVEPDYLGLLDWPTASFERGFTLKDHAPSPVDELLRGPDARSFVSSDVPGEPLGLPNAP